MIAIKDGVIVFENYYKGNKESSTCISMSVAKSFVSYLIGVALEEGKIFSLQDPVDEYAPILKGSGYEGVELKDVLQMSSGIRFVEDYGDPKSDVIRLITAFVSSSLNKFISSLPNERKPGTFFILSCRLKLTNENIR